MRAGLRQRLRGYKRLAERHRIALGLFLIGMILLGFWWYEANLKNVCELSGGSWEKIGPSKTERCNPRTTDRGKNCMDDSECQGFCLVESVKSEKGFCSEHRYFSGCINTMEDGEIVGLCWR